MINLSRIRNFWIKEKFYRKRKFNLEKEKRIIYLNRKKTFYFSIIFL
jgi:hypothetical protein